MPQSAFADWLLIPYVGIALGGAPNTIDLDQFRHVFERRVSFGGSLTRMGNGIFGLEVDLNYTPDFYQRTGQPRLRIPGLDSHLTTLMANAVIGVPASRTSSIGIQPYAAGGIGLLSANIVDATAVSTNHLAFNVGGGLHVFFTDRVGLRADLRYFRNLDNEERESFFGEDFGLPDFDYWRATFGLTLRFGR